MVGGDSGGERTQVEIASEEKQLLGEGSDLWWRGAIAGGGERLLEEGIGLR